MGYGVINWVMIWGYELQLSYKDVIVKFYHFLIFFEVSRETSCVGAELVWDLFSTTLKEHSAPALVKGTCHQF